jgi:hypothetical protein
MEHNYKRERYNRSAGSAQKTLVVNLRTERSLMASNNANLSVSWKSVAIAATVVAITSLIICGIIATINKADTLSVVALGLAIIAFVIQILIFIVQAAAAAQQDLHAQEIYGSTLRALATIEEKSEGTQRAVSTINDRMLVALLGKAIPEAASMGLPISSPEFSDAVAERVGELANQARKSSSSASQTPDKQQDEPQQDDDFIYTFPSNKEVQEALPALLELDMEAVSGLRYLGQDYSHSSINRGLRAIPGAAQLHEKGLVRRVRKAWSRDPIYILTPRGQTAARILLARDTPSDAPVEIQAIRAGLTKNDEEFENWRKRLGGTVPVEDDPDSKD